MAYRWFTRPKLALIPGLLALVFLIACGGAAPEAPTAAPQPVATTAAGSSPTATVAATLAPLPSQTEIVDDALNVGVKETGSIFGSGDPAQLGAPRIGRLNMTVFESLTVSAPNGDLEPRLATWEVSDDGLTWTFFLERGVQFHRGYGEMTAEDVTWSWIRSTDEGSKFGRAGPLRTVVREPNVVEIIDDHTINLTTEIPRYDTLFSFRTPYGGGGVIHSKQVWDQLGMEKAADTLIGTGPWQFVEARTGELWKLEAVEDHWRQTPFFRELFYFEIPEEATRVASLETGSLDTGEVAFQSLERLNQVPGMEFTSAPEGGQFTYNLWGQFYSVDRPGYNPDRPWVSSNPDVNSKEWDDARKVRLAMALAIDRLAIVSTMLSGEGRVQHYAYDAGTTWLDDLKAEDPEPFKYNPERARDLLAEAGYEDGFKAEVVCYPRGMPAEIEVCEAIASTMWPAIGIKTSISRLPYGTFRPNLFRRDHDVLAPHPLGTYPEPMALWINTHWVKGGANFGFEHPDFDAMMEKANTTPDAEARRKLTQEMARWIKDNVTHIPVYVPNIVYPAGPKIEPWPLQGGDKKLIHNFEFIQPRQQ